jgi:multidrug efflux pump subunit AcrA (membrane-fusion protein)
MNETREQLETQLADARRQRGFALMHGKKFDDSEIERLQKLLEVQEDIESAKATEAREDSAKATEAAIKAAQREIADLQSASAKAKAAADKALAEYVGAMKLHYQHCEQARKAIGRLNTLTGSQQAAPTIGELQKRDSMLLIQQLRQLSGHAEFGYVKLNHSERKTHHG